MINRAELYYSSLKDKKRLTQKERIFIKLYDKESLPCYYFSMVMKPAIMRYGARIDELRRMGFKIPPPKISYQEGVKHSVYTLVKE